jgi:hypothetical protein
VGAGRPGAAGVRRSASGPAAAEVPNRHRLGSDVVHHPAGPSRRRASSCGTYEVCPAASRERQSASAESRTPAPPPRLGGGGSPPTTRCPGRSPGTGRLAGRSWCCTRQGFPGFAIHPGMPAGPRGVMPLQPRRGEHTGTLGVISPSHCSRSPHGAGEGVSSARGLFRSW